MSLLTRVRADVVVLTAALGSMLPGPAPTVAGKAQEPPPRILLDATPRAIEYQLGRLSNAELTRVERKADDPRYRPIYYALLTRKGLGREYFDEALAALTTMEKASPTQVLIEALPKVGADDRETAEKLLRVLLGQPVDALRKERDKFATAVGVAGGVGAAPPPLVLRAAYGGMMLADGSPQRAWQSAESREGHLLELLRSVPHIGGAPELRARLSEALTALLASTQDVPTRAAALTALASARPDAATFRLLAREVQASDSELQAAAIQSLQHVPRDVWPKADVEPLVRTIVALVAKAGPEGRTEPAMIEAIQLAEKLADGLSDEPRRAIRRDVRALGVQVVRIETIPEQMAFDVKWFAVEAGKPVQIVLYNPDAMSHNLILSKPGSLKEIGTAASTMTLSADPDAKPYVPDTPLVLHATRLLNWGETERVSFAAPAAAGEYPFACTFPGHWVRMYGVMLVVGNLDAWENNRTVPNDPMTDRPFTSQRTQVTTGPGHF
jgi:azurin/DNA-binding transcriptional ArsR family regulator